ncbi:hypothetical protein E4T39_05097 [Aureobasidium subglaciale]|nr:hypothetical protein E4T39_05097 [Aureobasidium subglaciale]
MRASLSFLIALALSSHVDARGLKPRQTSGATSISPSSAVSNVSCNDVLHQHTHYVKLPVLSLQLLDLFRASSLDFLHCPLSQYDFVKCSVLDLFFFQHRLLDFLFLKHPMLDLVVHALLELSHKHRVLDFFLFYALLELDYLVLEFLVIRSMPKLEDIAYPTCNNSPSHSIISTSSLDDCNLGHQLHGLSGLSELHSLLRRLSKERHDLANIQVHYCGSYTGAGGDGQLQFLQWWKFKHLVLRYFNQFWAMFERLQDSFCCLTSTQKVVKESSVFIVPIASTKTIATAVESAASLSRNMNFPSVSTVVSPSASINVPSVGTVVVVSPPASVNTQMTVTIPVSKILTTCPCTTPLVHPPASSPQSPEVPATPMASPPAPHTVVLPTPVASPVSPVTTSANSPPAQLPPPAQIPPPSMAPPSLPSSPVVMPPQNSSPPQPSTSPGNNVPPQGIAPPAPPQSSPPEQPGSPPKSNSPPAVKTGPPPGATPSGPATKPSMPPATDTNISSGTIQSVKVSMLTFMAPVAVAVAVMLL